MPYMPLVIAAAAPWIAVLGDCRFELAVCLPITIALLRAAGRRLRVDAWMIDAVTLAWVLHPRGTLMVIKSYQEPLLVAVLALFVYLSAGDEDGYGAASAFFLLPALKQYVVAPVVIYAAMRRRRPSAVVVGAAVAAATVLPFLVWNAQRHRRRHVVSDARADRLPRRQRLAGSVRRPGLSTCTPAVRSRSSRSSSPARRRGRRFGGRGSAGCSWRRLCRCSPAFSSRRRRSSTITTSPARCCSARRSCSRGQRRRAAPAA